MKTHLLFIGALLSLALASESDVARVMNACLCNAAVAALNAAKPTKQPAPAPTPKPTEKQRETRPTPPPYLFM